MPVSEEKVSLLGKLRPKTKWAFVAYATIVFALSQLATGVLVDWLFGDPIREIKLSKVITSVVFGFLAGLVIWSLKLRRNKTNKPFTSEQSKK